MTNAVPPSAIHSPLCGDISGRNRVLPCPAIQARRRNSAQRSRKALPMRSATLPDGQSRAKEWINKYHGKFDQGWDKLREETLARQKQLGVVPSDTKLAAKPQAIKDWESLSPDEKRLFARQMEVFAGFGEYTDHEIGRLIEAIKNMGQL